MKKLPICFALFCILLAGCGDMSLRNILANSVAAAKVHGLLFFGSVQTSASDPNLTLPCYWNKGVLTLLPTGSQPNGSVRGYCAVGNDVYAFGTTQTGSASNTQTPVYWKNGELHTLPLPPNTRGAAQQGGFDASGNLYVRSDVTLTSTGAGIPGFWKNDAWNPLSMTLPDGTASWGSSNNGWTIHGNDIYFAGWLSDPLSGLTVPVYWENGVAKEVSLSSVPAAIYGGYVSAIIFPPYVATLTYLIVMNTATGGVPAYMIGSTITRISTGSAASGNAWWAELSPSGDLYAGGMIGPWPPSLAPVYWKNWSLVFPPTPNGYTVGNSGGPQFAGDDVYFDGNVWNANGFELAVYWKNGVLNVLPIGNYFGSSEGGFEFLE